MIYLLFFVVIECFPDAVYPLQHVFELWVILSRDSDKPSFVYPTTEQRHVRKCIGGNNANRLVCSWAVLEGMWVNHVE